MLKPLIIMLLACFFLVVAYGCAPVRIDHAKGELPRLWVDTGIEACKVRGKRQEIKLKCHWEF